MKFSTNSFLARLMQMALFHSKESSKNVAFSKISAAICYGLLTFTQSCGILGQARYPIIDQCIIIWQVGNLPW